MKTQLNWKKGIVSSTYEIFSKGTLVGRLKENSLRQSAEGELYGKKFSFKTKGFLKQETQIIDANNNISIGRITYNSWMTKAKIECSGKVVHWKYDNAWNTRWSLVDPTGMQLKYQGTSSKGKIELEEQNELLLLTGLYITNYYWQTSIAVLIAIFVPLWTTIFH